MFIIYHFNCVPELFHIYYIIIDYRSYGVPTIRSDRPAPLIRRVGDSTVSH